MKSVFLALLAALSLYGANAVSETGRRDSLVVSRSEAGYKLTVPVSRLAMTIADAKLEQQPASGGAMSSPRYFSFADPARGLILSGWFEPAHLFKGISRFWADETQAWQKQGLPEPQNIELFSQDGWQIVCYDMTLPDVTNTHLRAHWVQAGTWIDVHISLTGKPENGISRQALLEILKNITVVERSDG